VDVLLRRGRSESPLIKNTLAQGSDAHGSEALEQIYRCCAGRGAEPRDGAAGARAAVLPPQAVRPGAGGPLQDSTSGSGERPEGPTVLTRTTSSRFIRLPDRLRKGAATPTTSTTSATAGCARWAS